MPLQESLEIRIEEMREWVIGQIKLKRGRALSRAAGVSYPWIRAFSQGQIKTPGLDKWEALETFRHRRTPDERTDD